MTRAREGFTLIELIIVMSIIALLILIFVPQVPAIVRWHRVHLSKVVMTQLEFGLDEYKRVYGEYPHDLVVMHANGKRMLNSITDSGQCTYLSTQGYYGLYLTLQGPDGTGWGPTADFPGVKEFGPVPESPGFVSRDLKYERPFFEDPFGRPILYYSARMDSHFPYLNSGQASWKHRYDYTVNHTQWRYGAGASNLQRGVDEATGGKAVMDGEAAPLHWMVRLTRSKDNYGYRYPHNPRSYLIWMAGADERFGYWLWSDKPRGFVADPDPENAADGRVGVCDDLTNF